MSTIAAASSLTLSSGIESFDQLVSETFCSMSCDTPAEYRSSFQGGLVSQRLGAMGFAAVKSSPLDVYRRSSHIATYSSSSYLVKVQVEGEGLVSHRGKRTRLLPGDFTLCLSSEPYELHFPSQYCQVVLEVPEHMMDDCVHQPTRLLGVRMDGSVGANGLFSQFVTSIGQQLDVLDGVLAQRLEANVLDLLSTTLNYAQESRRRDLLECGVKREYLQRIKQFIRRNLDDERLNPEWIADAHDISTRYLHMLFESEEMTVSRYLIRLRLEACKLALQNLDFSRYSVSEIAYSFGFKDASHFSRAFKAEYGDSPARYRKQHMMH